MINELNKARRRLSILEDIEKLECLIRDLTASPTEPVRWLRVSESMILGCGQGSQCKNLEHFEIRLTEGLAEALIDSINFKIDWKRAELEGIK